MRKQFGVLLAALFYYTGLIGLARWLQQRSGPRLIILNYHHASGEDLRRHLLYLRRHYRVLHLDEALTELYAPAERWATKRDKRALVALTFDDGYHDNYTHAFSLARELRMPITIFLIPGYVESGDYFWWGEGRRLVQRAGVAVVTLEGRTYRLDALEEKARLSQTIDARLRHASSIVEREAFLAQVRELLAVPGNVTVEEEKDRPMSWAEIQKMQESGWVSYGAHTMHHPILAYLSDPADLHYEVSECRKVLEQRLACPVRSLAYPVGRAEHIGEEVVQAVKDAGYAWAVTTYKGSNTPASDPYLLKRMLSDSSRNWLVMAAETSGIWDLLAPLWKAVIGKGEDVA
ncbi:polysaccharide deacetylase family protein [Ktedonosporobacter rubrisoli]|nr:polysaccharide deacetylase family protein [Ktedonosporobacter rubrisoli]